ncbi:MAG: hypothetical protein N0E48_26885 [Candidatus Thiodiazotropha endolucinida]|nr:hypothetical protein [Candidatus Thiodiazotropha endolucinida]
MAGLTGTDRVEHCNLTQTHVQAVLKYSPLDIKPLLNGVTVLTDSDKKQIEQMVIDLSI